MVKTSIITAPASWQDISNSDEGFPYTTAEASTLRDRTYIPQESNSQHHLITQVKLTGLVCDLYLCKQQAELLGSCLKELNLLDKHIKIHCIKIETKI